MYSSAILASARYMYNLVMLKNEADIKLPERLRRARKERGLTQQAAADAFEISLRGYCRWEAGEREPSLSALCAISARFGVTTDWLLGLSDVAPFDGR